MNARVLAAAALLVGVVAAGSARAHCEIPCGIYDDQQRIHVIEEHIGTIEKAMGQIVEIGGQTPVNHNQLVRWITNKEHHANEIQTIVAQYFMTQRIKPSTGEYEKKLSVLHKMLLAAMECKQTTDLAHARELGALTKEFSTLYFE
jgi:nickel superoxide dismutase